nr:glycoside hydrolase [Oscillospiraceae bacterium]
VETPKWAEWEIAAVLNGSGNSYTEVKAWAMNHTAWPARVAKDIEYRYYFDISELTAAGLSISDVTVEGKSQQYSAGQQGYATVSGPYQYDGSIYYALIKFEDGRAICPIGQSEHRDEVQFRISIPDASGVKWDPTNDPSYEGLTATDSLKSDKALNKHITMYVDGKLVWGIEPDGTEPDPYTTPSKESQTTTSDSTTTTSVDSSEPPVDNLYGDVDCSGSVMIADAILLARYCAEDQVSVTAQGKRNANCYDSSNDLLTTEDIAAILELLAGIIQQNELPKQP